MEAPQPEVPSPAVTPKKQPRPAWMMILMIAAACVLCIPCTGVVAALAIPAFINYVKRGKVAEAHAELGALAHAVEQSCRTHASAPIEAGPLPVVPGSTKQVGGFENDPGFVALGYSQHSPVYYSYSVRTEGDGMYVIAAEGDLDNDLIRSRFEIRCTPQCACGEVSVEKELE